MSLHPSTLSKDFRLLVYLFFFLRLLLLLVFIPSLIESDDPSKPDIVLGMAALGDFYEHFFYASRITPDNLPYRDYWVEFPPVWITLAALLAQATQNFTRFAAILYFLFALLDLANLFFVRALGTRLYGREVGLGLAWTYALLPLSLIMTGWNFEILVALTFLGALLAWIDGKHGRAVGWLVLGGLTKYLPVTLLGAVWRFAPPRLALRYSVLVGLGMGAVLGPLVAWGGQMALTSLTVQAQKPSYQSVWALLDGNYRSGVFPTGEARADASAQTVRELGNPPVVPSPLRWALVGAALGWLWLARPPDSPHNRLYFVTATLLIVMLGSGGWSPQWMVTLTPLLLLCFPSRVGVLLILTLVVNVLVEFPGLFRTNPDDGTLIIGAVRPIFAVSILLRTAILIGIVWVLRGRLANALRQDSPLAEPPAPPQTPPINQPA